MRRTKEEFHLECAKGKDMPTALAALAENRIVDYELQNVLAYTVFLKATWVCICMCTCMHTHICDAHIHRYAVL